MIMFVKLLMLYSLAIVGLSIATYNLSGSSGSIIQIIILSLSLLGSLLYNVSY